MIGGLAGPPLWRLGLRLAWRQKGRFLFFGACLSLGVGFLVAVAHLLAAADRAVALRARELLAGDLEVRAARPFGPREREAFSRALAPGRRSAEAVSFASMLSPASGGTPVLVSVKAVDPAAYPLRGALETAPPGGASLLAGGGRCLIERALSLQHGLRPGDRVRLGASTLEVAGVIEREPDRGFGGFSFAPRLMLAASDLPATRLLGLGARTRFSWTLALAEGEDPVGGAKAAKAALEADLAEPHLSIRSYTDGEPAVSRGLDRASRFFTLLSLVALLLGAAGLKAGLALFLDSQADAMGLLRCLGASSREVESLYGGLCAGAGLLGGLSGAALGWGLAAAAASQAPRFGVALSVPLLPSAAAEAALLSVVLAWGLSAARARGLAERAPLDALRAPPEAPRALVLAGWAAAALVVSLAAWRRSETAGEAAKLLLALAGGALAVELLARAALKGARRAAEAAAALGAALPLRHGLRRLVRRPGTSHVMLFTLAGGFAMLAAVSTAREGLSRALAPALAEETPDLFLVDIQPRQLRRARDLASRRAGGEAAFAPLVRARLVAVDGRRLSRRDFARSGPEERERRRLRSREYNLTYAEALTSAERVTEGRFWSPGTGGAEASVERGFLERAGLELGSRLTFDVQGREVEAAVTSAREVEWASMRPNFFVTLSPALLEGAPRTYIGSLRSKSPEDAAELRKDLARELPNVSVIDAASLVSRVRETLGLLLSAIAALAGFCVVVGALVVGGLVALGREERAADAALERALGWTARETLAADACELGALGLLAGASGAAVAAGLGWAVARRLGVPFAADPAEAAALFAAAVVLPVAVGLAVGAPGREAAVMDSLRREA